MSTTAATQFTYLTDIQPRTGVWKKWTHLRHHQAHWLVECVSEAVGVFIYSWCGGSAQAAYVLGNLTGATGLASVLTVGFAYAFGVGLALIVSNPTSGGHCHPAVTIAQVVYKRFPVQKAWRYIIAQIIGGYIAFGFIYLQYWDLFHSVEAKMHSSGTYDSTMFTAAGPAGIFAPYAPVGFKLGFVFLNEFVVDFFIGLTIFSCLDPTNLFIPVSLAPWIIGMAFGVSIWGFIPNGLALNTARDLGGRFMAMTIWGAKASGGTYAAIAALTNIAAMLCAATFYEFWLADDLRVLNMDTKLFMDAHEAHLGRVALEDAAMGMSTARGTSTDKEGFVQRGLGAQVKKPAGSPASESTVNVV